MKKLLIVLLATVALGACSRVPAGNVGVKVYLLGGSKGVDTEELGPGRYWIGWNEELYLFPTFTQNYTWVNEKAADESISFQTREGLSVNADIGISYRVDPTKATAVFQKYRKGIDEITDIYLRNMVRDALVTVSSSLPIEAVYGEGKSDLMDKVETMVRDQVQPMGILIERIYWIGNVRLPEGVIKALNLKIEAVQRSQQRENEVQEARAEAQKKIEAAKGEAESTRVKAEAEAQANRIVAQSISGDLIRYHAIGKWDGVLPRMTGTNAVPFVDVTGNAK